METQICYCAAVILLVYTSVCYGQATRDVDICTSHSSVIQARLARVRTPHFPDPVNKPRNCRCSITSTDVMDIAVKFMLVMQQGTQISVNYKTASNAGSWPLGYNGIMTVSEDNNLIIANNVSSAEIVFKSIGDDKSWSRFQVNMKASPLGVLSVNCSEYPVENGTSADGDHGVLSALEKICSPYLVIILGSMCTAFLLIILVVSILLCCLVPKKRKKYLDVIRRSRAMNHEIKPDKYKKKSTTESLIYDEATFRRSQATYLEPPQVYSNSTLPVSQARNSVPLYTNADAIRH